MSDYKGFSLVELMVVIAIIAILAAVGIPIYNNLIMKNHRHDATAELYSISNAADNQEIRNGSFPAGDIDSFWHNNTTDAGYYSLEYCSGINCPGVNYEITATAIGRQAGDTACSKIILEVKGGITNKTPSDCWK